MLAIAQGNKLRMHACPKLSLGVSEPQPSAEGVHSLEPSLLTFDLAHMVVAP